MKMLGFDVGTKRIGVAVSDPGGTIAAAIGFIENNENMEEELKKHIDANKPEMFVVGNPINMNGTANTKSTFVGDFIEVLKRTSGEREIKLWDERLTTVMAEKALIKGNVRRKKRKQLIDKVAAVLILQNYLDYLKNMKR